jgi:hypothetical protein
MRLVLLFVGLVIGGAVANPSAGSAANYPWCAYYGFDLDGTNCGFVSFGQCMAAISGNGGYCGQNLQYRPVPNQPPPRRYRQAR